MINLLPPEEKKELSLKNRNRLIIIIGSVFLAALVCMVFILIFVKVYIAGENISQKEKIREIGTSYGKIDFFEAEKEIVKYNKDMENLKSFYSGRAYFGKMLDSVSGVNFPKGVYLAGISAVKGPEKGLKVDVYGFSETRDSLLVFKENVEAEENIKNPIFSQDSWVKKENINFHLTFQY